MDNQETSVPQPEGFSYRVGNREAKGIIINQIGNRLAEIYDTTREAYINSIIEKEVNSWKSLSEDEKIRRREEVEREFAEKAEIEASRQILKTMFDEVVRGINQLAVDPNKQINQAEQFFSNVKISVFAKLELMGEALKIVLGKEKEKRRLFYPEYGLADEGLIEWQHVDPEEFADNGVNLGKWLFETSVALHNLQTQIGLIGKEDEPQLAKLAAVVEAIDFVNVSQAVEILGVERISEFMQVEPKVLLTLDFWYRKYKEKMDEGTFPPILDRFSRLVKTAEKFIRRKLRRAPHPLTRIWGGFIPEAIYGAYSSYRDWMMPLMGEGGTSAYPKEVGGPIWRLISPEKYADVPKLIMGGLYFVDPDKPLPLPDVFTLEDLEKVVKLVQKGALLRGREVEIEGVKLPPLGEEASIVTILASGRIGHFRQVFKGKDAVRAAVRFYSGYEPLIYKYPLVDAAGGLHMGNSDSRGVFNNIMVEVGLEKLVDPEKKLTAEQRADLWRFASIMGPSFQLMAIDKLSKDLSSLPLEEQKSAVEGFLKSIGINEEYIKSTLAALERGYKQVQLNGVKLTILGEDFIVRRNLTYGEAEKFTPIGRLISDVGEKDVEKWRKEIAKGIIKTRLGEIAWISLLDSLPVETLRVELPQWSQVGITAVEELRMLMGEERFRKAEELAMQVETEILRRRVELARRVLYEGEDFRKVKLPSFLEVARTVFPEGSEELNLVADYYEKARAVVLSKPGEQTPALWQYRTRKIQEVLLKSYTPQETEVALAELDNLRSPRYCYWTERFVKRKLPPFWVGLDYNVINYNEFGSGAVSYFLKATSVQEIAVILFDKFKDVLKEPTRLGMEGLKMFPESFWAWIKEISPETFKFDRYALIEWSEAGEGIKGEKGAMLGLSTSTAADTAYNLALEAIAKNPLKFAQQIFVESKRRFNKVIERLRRVNLYKEAVIASETLEKIAATLKSVVEGYVGPEEAERIVAKMAVLFAYGILSPGVSQWKILTRHMEEDLLSIDERSGYVLVTLNGDNYRVGLVTQRQPSIIGTLYQPKNVVKGGFLTGNDVYHVIAATVGSFGKLIPARPLKDAMDFEVGRNGLKRVGFERISVHQLVFHLGPIAERQEDQEVLMRQYAPWYNLFIGNTEDLKKAN